MCPMRSPPRPVSVDSVNARRIDRGLRADLVLDTGAVHHIFAERPNLVIGAIGQIDAWRNQ